MKTNVRNYLRILSMALILVLCLSMAMVHSVFAEDESDRISFFIEDSGEDSDTTVVINIGINAPKDMVYSGDFRVYYDTRFLERVDMAVNSEVLNDYYDAYEFEVLEGEVYLEFSNYQMYVPEGKSVLMSVRFNLKSEGVAASFDEAGFMNNLFNFQSYTMRDKEENVLKVVEPAEYTLGKTFVVLMGDPDCSGDINVKDATMVQKVLAKMQSMDGTLTFATDVTADGKLNIKDATAIQKYCAKIAVQANIGILQVYTV